MFIMPLSSIWFFHHFLGVLITRHAIVSPLVVSSSKSISSLPRAQPYFLNTTTIEFLSTSHGVRTEYPSDRTWHLPLPRFLASDMPLGSYMQMSALTYICVYPPTYFAAQHKGYNDSFNVQLVFFPSRISIYYCERNLEAFPVLLRFHAFLIRLISYFSYCKYILSTSCCGERVGHESGCGELVYVSGF